MTKKKSLVGWAYKEVWIEDFFADKMNPVEVNLPYLFTRKSTSKDYYDKVKVRITIEEIK